MGQRTKRRRRLPRRRGVATRYRLHHRRRTGCLRHHPPMGQLHTNRSLCILYHLQAGPDHLRAKVCRPCRHLPVVSASIPSHRRLPKLLQASLLATSSVSIAHMRPLPQVEDQRAMATNTLRLHLPSIFPAASLRPCKSMQTPRYLLPHHPTTAKHRILSGRVHSQPCRILHNISTSTHSRARLLAHLHSTTNAPPTSPTRTAHTMSAHTQTRPMAYSPAHQRSIIRVSAMRWSRQPPTTAHQPISAERAII